MCTNLENNYTKITLKKNMYNLWQHLSIVRVLANRKTWQKGMNDKLKYINLGVGGLERATKFFGTNELIFHCKIMINNDGKACHFQY